MSYRRAQPRSPPRNFKVNFVESPPLDNASQNHIMNIVPKLARAHVNPEDLQIELSKELCKYLGKSVGVLIQQQQNETPPMGTHLSPVTFSFTMNENLFKIWIHEDQVEF